MLNATGEVDEIVLTQRLASCASAAFLALVGIVVAPGSAEAQLIAPQRFVSASSLNVRAVPELGSQVLGVLEINTEVDVLRALPVTPCQEGGPTPCGPKEGWCLIEALGRIESLGLEANSRDPENLRGYVACEYLSEFRADAKHLERELERLRGFGDKELGALGPEGIALAFDLAGRIFALDRSLANLKRYEELLNALIPGWNDSTPRLIAADRVTDAERARRIAAYRAMESQVGRDLGREIAMRPRDQNARFYKERQAKDPRFARRGSTRAKSASFFLRDSDITAWAGGFAVDGQRSGRSIVEGVKYFLTIDKHDNIRPLYAIARNLGITPSLKVYEHGASSAERGRSENDTEPGTVLEATIKGFAITPDAVRDADVLRVANFGGECNEPASGVDFRLQRPESQVLAVFVTPKRFDAGKARVLKREIRYRASPDTLSHDVTFEVDLDGDGIADLRGGFDDNHEIDPQEPTPKEFRNKISLADPRDELASFFPLYPARFRRVAGWYANNTTWIEANIGGVWKVVSVYSASSCT